jgi:hypothetical protein
MSESAPPARSRSGLVARLIFLALLAGGLILWAQLRKPRDLVLELDLTDSLPGDVQEVDVLVRRGGEPLTRSDRQYGDHGAPGTLQILVHAQAGDAEVETTLVYRGGKAVRTTKTARLSADETARVHP